MSGKNLISFQFIVLLLLIPCLAKAEMVYDGEFVIEANDVEEFSSVTAKNSNTEGIKELGNNTRLLSFGDFSLNGKGKIASEASDKTLREVNEGDYRFCEQLVASGLAKSCSPNFRISISTVPNDEKYDQLWGLTTSIGIGADNAWATSTGSHDVVVGVVDTGIDYNHPDLANNIWVNSAEIPGNGIDDDKNGYVDDVYGMSALDTEGDPMDVNGHGTHVSGIIGASGNNKIGVAGVNWNVKIMGCRFLNASGSGSLAGAIEAINYAVEMKKRGVNIVALNNSWGGTGYSQALYSAIASARDVGIVFVAAAGNENNNNDIKPTYPASYNLDNVISVAAIGRNQSLASFSNYGSKSVDIAAPGVAIMSTYLNKQYKSMSGTSMATPYVTGSVALYSAVYQGQTPSAIKERLIKTARTHASLNGKLKNAKIVNLAGMLSSGSDETISCEYKFETSSSSVDDTFLQREIISNDDELEFKTVDLGFEFPFYGQSYSKVTISPNGVLYFQPSGNVDYKHEDSAPSYSIAALHTDLIFPETGHGIRVEGTKDHYTVSWYGRSYESIYEGDVEVRATMYPSGTIEVKYSFEKAEIAEIVGKNSTIGVAAGYDSVHTYAYDNAELFDGLKLTMVPSCQSKGGSKIDKEPSRKDEVQPASASSIRISALNKKGKMLKKAQPNAFLEIALSGNGTGSLPMSVYLNGKQCGEEFAIDMNNGYAFKKVKLNNNMKRYKNIKVASGTVFSNKLQVKKVSKLNTNKAKSKRLFAKDCYAIIKNLSM